MSSILEPLDPLLASNRSAVAEGNVFSILSHSPFVVRSFEFALVDGAVDCTHTHEINSTFADRLWAVDQGSRMPDTASELMLFDIKSSFNLEHRYMSTLFQKRRVAFYICISSADPTFVDLIPNYSQVAESYATSIMAGEENRKVSINNGRVSRFPLRTYRLDPTNAPHRMPLYLLPTAIELVRLCAKGEGIYINPWTGVKFPSWSPRTTTSSRHIKPAEHTSHFTAFKAAIDIYRLVHHSSALTPMLVDLAGLQPRIADFKLILPAPLTSSSRPISPSDFSHSTRQVFVQHKIDSGTRRRSDKLDKVKVARVDREKPQYWFSSLNRFDFFFLQFTFSEGPNTSPRTSFLFLPERLIPDSFYQSFELYQSFQRPEFKPYFMAMDEEGVWVTHMQRIVEANHIPQLPGRRPDRHTGIVTGLEGDSELTVNVENPARFRQLSPMLPSSLHDSQKSSRGDLADVMRFTQTLFFQTMMRECAQRRSGILVIFSTNHPVCDFGFCRYSWTEHDVELFLRRGKPPRTLHELPASTPVIPICYYAQHGETTFEGPSVSSAQFRRLDCCSVPRLVFWDLFGPDSHSGRESPVIIPSPDISATAKQRSVLGRNLGRAASAFATPTPTLSALLNRGLFASEYRVQRLGPEGYGHQVLASIWELLDRFTLTTPVEHPQGFLRHPETYRCPLEELHQRLAEELAHSGEE